VARRPTVLLVDDAEDFRDVVEELLQLEGFIVMSAANGAEALEILRSGPAVQAILLDLTMPVMDGWAFRTAQRQQPDLAAVPTIVLTGTPIPSNRETELAGTALITKPFRFDDLVDQVRAACHTQRPFDS
jgi:CheY-like chemotaxis protein